MLIEQSLETAILLKLIFVNFQYYYYKTKNTIFLMEVQLLLFSKKCVVVTKVVTNL